MANRIDPNPSANTPASETAGVAPPAPPIGAPPSPLAAENASLRAHVDQLESQRMQQSSPSRSPAVSPTLPMFEGAHNEFFDALHKVGYKGSVLLAHAGERLSGDAGKIAAGLAHAVNTGMAGTKAAEEINKVDADGATKLLAAAMAAKVQPSQAHVWLRERFPEPKPDQHRDGRLGRA